MNTKVMKALSALAAVFVTCLVVALLGWMFCWVTIDKGHVGVMSTFGNVHDDTLQPGAHLVAPWKKVLRMNCQTTKDEEPAKVPTKNGLSVDVNATLLYHLDPSKAPQMAKEVGHDYAGRVVTPYFKNAVRDATAEFEAEALYTKDRVLVEQKVVTQLEKVLGERGIVVEAVMLLDPVLPNVVKERVEAKVAAEQDAIRMQSVFKSREQEAMANKRRKELEAESLVIEARGIAEAQTIIKKDLDENYLMYLFIETIKENGKHGNTTVYIPTGGNGLPMFKGVK